MKSAISGNKKGDSSDALTEAIECGNFVRAEGLARSLNRPEAEIRDLQGKAFRQFVVELRNPHGAIALAKEFNFSREDVDRLLQRIVEESRQEEEEGNEGSRRRFDMKTKRYLDLEEWIREYFKSGKWQKSY